MITLQTIQNAKKTITPLIKKTPLVYSQFLSAFCNGEVYLKLENQQLTNSFKIRGALNRMSQLNPDEKKRGVVTASSGNHGQAVALAAEHLQLTAKIVVPALVSKAKLDKIQKFDVEVIQEKDGTPLNYDDVEPFAREIAEQEGLTYISPYNDEGIIAGQGTVGLEILEDLDVDTIIVPIGGGGLISGIALAAKSNQPTIQILGVQSEASPTMYESWKQGKILPVEEENSYADGLMGGLEQGTITFDLIRHYVDEVVLVKEETIKEAIFLLYENEQQITEGAGAISISPILENKDLFKGKTTVSVISGGNIENTLLQDILTDFKK